MTCAETRDRAAEFALGILPGDERAAVIAHVERCAACRAEVRSLSAVVDELVAAAPEREPPAGFELRVLDALPPRPRRRLLHGGAIALVAAAFLLGAVIAVGVGALRDEAPSPPAAAPAVDPQLQQAILWSPEGAPVGAASLATSGGAWLDMNLIERPDERYACVVVLRDGRSVQVGDLPAGTDWWGGRIDVPAADVVAVRVVEPDGSLFGEGRMPLAS